MKRLIPRMSVFLVSLALVFGLALWMVTGQSEDQSPESPAVQTAVSTPSSPPQPGTSPGMSPSTSLPAPTSKLANPQAVAARAAAARANPLSRGQVVQTAQQIRGNVVALKERQQQNAQQPNKPMRGLPRGGGHIVPNPDQQQAIDDLLSKLGEDTVLEMDNLSGTLRYLRGDLKQLVEKSEAYRDAESRKDYGGMSVALAGEIKTVLNVQDPEQEFFAEKVTEDELGMVHVVLQQQYQGAPVWGAEIGVHFNSDKEPVQMSGVYAPTPAGMPETEAEISQNVALVKAKEAVGMTGEGLTPPKVEKMVYWDLDRAPVMCYNVDLTPDHAHAWEIFISTADGSVVHRYDKMVYAAAVGQSADLKGTVRQINCWEEGGVYLAIDTFKPIYQPSSQPPDLDKTKGAFFILDYGNQDPNSQNINLDFAKTTNVNQWDPAVVSLSNNLTRTENYYRTLFSRSSIDDKNMNIVSILHFRWATSGGGSHNDNACWNPNVKALYFGDGDNADGGIMPHDIDTVAHEYTHGITDFTANLIYENQSGALHEHFSDFFACMVDRDDWLIGEDTTSVPGKIALRDVQNPGNPNVISSLPATMADYRYMPIDQDQGGVHINMGIPSRMSYLLAEGPNGITREKTEKIVYRAQTHYLTQKGQFIDYRRAAISAATDLYGAGSAEVQAVEKAFDDVGITEGQGTPDSTPGEVVSGDEAILFLVADPSAGVDPFRQDYYYKLAINALGQNNLLAPRYVANARPVASGDGQWALYVDATNNIFWTNGESEDQWTQDGIVRTIAMSKNQRYVAFTTIDYANTIYFIDTQSEESFLEVDLSVPVKDADDVELYFADVMTFNFRGDHMIYDAVSEIKLVTGETYFAWGLYGLRLADLNSYLVMPQTPGEEIGNPIFSHTNDNLLLADLELAQGSQSSNHVIVLDFNQGESAVLLSNLPVMGRPSFQGDDRHIIFRSVDESGLNYYLAGGALADDNFSLEQGALNLFYSDLVPIEYPFGFRVGEYTPYEGKISVPAAVALGDVPVGSLVETTLTVTN
ncbi:MAG: M4 family metallopeptidase, partial [bacterium]